MKALTTLKQKYWTARNPREQRMLSIAAAVVIPIFGYLLLWEPAQLATDKLNQQLPQLRAQAAQLQADSLEVKRLKNQDQPTALNAQTLKNTLESTAKQQQLDKLITSITPKGQNSVSLVINAIAFEQWIRWLRFLQQSQHVRTESASIIALPQPGMVKINAVLTSGASY